MHRVLKKAEKLNISYPKNMYEYNGEGQIGSAGLTILDAI